MSKARHEAPYSLRYRAGYFALLAFCLMARPAAGADKTLLVSAAISLKDVLTRSTADFEKKSGQVKIEYNFASTGQLRAQIEYGAPVDVFASASAGDMDLLSQKGLIIEASRVNLATNRLALIVKKGQARTLKDIGDLASDRVRRIAVGNPDTVPAGRYARESLTYYRLYDTVRPKLILGENARQVLDYVARGEVDAGLVYLTDALVERQVTVIDELPDDTHKPIVYPVAVIRSSNNMRSAGEFIRFLQSPGNSRILRDYGFGQGK